MGATEGPKQHLIFPEMEAERDAAENVKQHERILVVIGNPPYNGFAGVGMEEEHALPDAYRETKLAPTPQGQGLNDFYVRFFRVAERKIVDGTGAGIVCMISNYSWLDGLSHSGMRERYMEVFDQISIDRLNGDKYKTGKLTPGGDPDPSVFSTDQNPEGIQVGTAVAMLVRRKLHARTEAVLYRDFWGREKRAELLKSQVLGDRAPGTARGAQSINPRFADKHTRTPEPHAL
jgi:predicted helicase